MGEETTSPPVLDYAKAESGFDAGLFVARYLQTLAWLSIALMVIEPIFFDRLNIDITFIINFWAASALKRHSSTARWWVLLLCWWGVVALIAAMLVGIFSGATTIRLGGTRIADPALWQIVVAFSIPGILIGVPLVVLMSKQARREFEPLPRRVRRKWVWWRSSRTAKSRCQGSADADRGM